MSAFDRLRDRLSKVAASPEFGRAREWASTRSQRLRENWVEARKVLVRNLAIDTVDDTQALKRQLEALEARDRSDDQA